MKSRIAKIERITKETQIIVSLNLDGSAKSDIDTGIGFLDHMLDQITIHGVFDLKVKASGDLYIDVHHTIEDIAITLGQAFNKSIGDKAGINRISHSYVPMDESLVLVALDFSNRPFSVIDVAWSSPYLGSIQNHIIPVTLIDHFLQSFALNAGITLHVKLITGKNDHHKAEAIFKALGRTLDFATRVDPKRKGKIPSTKGTLVET